MNDHDNATTATIIHWLSVASGCVLAGIVLFSFAAQFHGSDRTHFLLVAIFSTLCFLAFVVARR
jgi:bacteriorhodopsin